MTATFTYDENEVQQAAAQTINFAGSYNVEITRAEFSNSKRTGFPMFVLDYKVTDGTEAGNMIYSDYFVDDSDDTKQDKRFWSFQRINSLLKALGGLKQGAVFDLETVDKVLVGKKLNITVTWRKNEYNGKTTYRPNVVDLQGVQPASKPDTSKPRPEAKENTNGTNPFGSPSNAPAQPMGAAPLPTDADDPFNGTGVEEQGFTDPFNN